VQPLTATNLYSALFHHTRGWSKQTSERRAPVSRVNRRRYIAPSNRDGVLSNSEDRLSKFDIHAYARRGAEARIVELQGELDSIYEAFPDLRQRSKAVSSRTAAAGKDSATSPTRRRRRMTAAQRKAVGERMRKYWAERRKAAKSK